MVEFQLEENEGYYGKSLPPNRSLDFQSILSLHSFVLQPFGVAMLLGHNYSISISVKADTFIRWFDRNSCYFYLTHYTFTKMGWYNLFENDLSFTNVSLYIVLTIVTGLALGIISDKIINLLSNKNHA